MRDRESWHRPVSKKLNQHWGEVKAARTDVTPAQLCQVELGLRLLQRLAPDRAPSGVWVLLGGYPFARAAGIAVREEDEWLLTNARHLLWTLRRRRLWSDYLKTYQALPDRLRGYRLPDSGSGPARQVEPQVAGDRFTAYDAALEELPGFTGRPLHLAPPGSSSFADRRRPSTVIIPAELIAEPASGHDLAPGRRHTVPSTVRRTELLETARWMDRRISGDWEGRLSGLRLAIRSTDGTDFLEKDEAEEELPLESLLHLVGMVGAGKSTLMILIAVWAARLGLRTTLVVSDVAEQLRITAQLRELGLPAPVSPVLGPTTRESHVQRLHRRQAARGQDNLLLHDDPGFDDLSTVCVVDALRGTDAQRPLRYTDAPCTSLFPDREPAEGADREQDDEPLSGDPHGCPLWSRCPRHGTAREQVDALIWVANPASLVQTSVPRHLNRERLRQLELTCLRSDIVIVDEADRVQMLLDDMFAPSATLVTRGPESWLDKIQNHKTDELARQGRLPLTEREIERWSSSLEVVGTAANRLYPRLISDPELRAWVETDYFSAWTLQEKLLEEWYPTRDPHADPPDGLPDERMLYAEEDEPDAEDDPPLRAVAATPWAAAREHVTAVLDAFRDDPLGDKGPYRDDTDLLVRAAQDLLHSLDDAAAQQRLIGLLDLLLEGSPVIDGALTPPGTGPVKPPAVADAPGGADWYRRTAKRLAFTLLLAVLHHRLDRLTWLWPQVEAALHLDATDNELSRRPPQDYAPIVPESPMGNVLGFQYLEDPADREEPDPDGRRSGTLRFFRCAGVGRELLLALSRLGADPTTGKAGPRVILMSGTSWAGTSTRAHLPVPVGAVLKPAPEALEAIRGTTFTTRFLYNADHLPYSLSGQNPKVRPAVLRSMITALAGPSRAGRLSPLQEELALIEDGRRKRALLLVGSYREAAEAARQLHSMDRWRKGVRLLVADNAELGPPPHHDSPADREESATAVRRGDLASFAEDESAELLIAPLLAIERGHNILNEAHQAAFGTVLFLARPHPRPDDLSLAIFAINDWAARLVRDQPVRGGETFSGLVAAAKDLDAAGLAFRHTARQEWRRLLSRRYMYSRLDEDEKISFTWDQLVTIWQVIGRLVRGGVPARVVFVDARFAPALAMKLAPGTPPNGPARRATKDAGLLPRLHQVLEPYFRPDARPADFPDPADPALVRQLYEPLHTALAALTRPARHS
ncbi:signal recognition particle [Streptomyces carpaticus]|uniref:pPIWI_RE_Z domain-containing protein n=1 Tax=Streptomyces carpaticus TaxID=285558 RepID=UPI0021FDCFCD|nr:signal recognition particle [Streptomyces carpaticus]